MTFRRLFTADDIHNYFWKARPSAEPTRTNEDHMGSHGIKDRVAIVGMGCTPFGEHWDKGTDDLLIDAAEAAYRSSDGDNIVWGTMRDVEADNIVWGTQRT